MLGFLFFHWISHFIQLVQERSGVSPNCMLLLVLDGHNSLVTI
jgi:hypothetical protein